MLQSAAEQGYPEALFLLGALYLYGEDAPEYRDPKLGVSYTREAARRGHRGAIENLAKCYEKGLGVRKSWRNARKLRALLKQKGGDPRAVVEALEGRTEDPMRL